MALTYYAGRIIRGVAADSKPTNVAEGTFFIETDTGFCYILIGGLWQKTESSGTSPEQIMTYPLSATIGDYATPAGPATASSSDADVQHITVAWGVTSTGNLGIDSVDPDRAGEEITDTALQSKPLISVQFKLSKSGSPTGAISVRCRKVSDDSIVATSTTSLDASALTTTPTLTTFNFAAGVTTPAETFRITIEYGGGNDANTVLVDNAVNEGVYAGGNGDSYSGTTWSNYGADWVGQLVYSATLPAAAIDNNTAIYWQSESEVNPWLRIEMSASADKEPASVALRTKSSTTATQIKIELSDDGSTWVLFRTINVNLLTHGAYNFFRFNRGTKAWRYLRIMATDGGSVILAIDEVKTRTPTESQYNREHGHKTLSTTLATLALAA